MAGHELETQSLPTSLPSQNITQNLYQLYCILKQTGRNNVYVVHFSSLEVTTLSETHRKMVFIIVLLTLKPLES